MNVQEIYEGSMLQEIFKKLQEPRITGKRKRTISQVCGPEVMSDSLVDHWLALNYIFATGFYDSGKLLMGETGGIIPKHPEGGRVLAIARASMEKVGYGIGRAIVADRTGNKEIISKLEEEIETKILERNGVTIIDGNRNLAHYDFTTTASIENLAELFKSDEILMLSAEGYTILSNRCLRGQSYVLNVPANMEVLEALRHERDSGRRIDIVKKKREAIIPQDFVAGFHIAYEGDSVFVSPLIPEKTLKQWESVKKDLKPVRSEIVHLGDSDPYGRFGVIPPFLDSSN